MQQFPFLDRVYYGVSLWHWLEAAAIAAVVFGALVLVRHLLVRRLAAVAERTTTDWDDLAVELVRRTRRFFLALIAVYAASRYVAPPAAASRILSAAAVIIALLQAGVWGNGVIGFLAERYIRRQEGDSGTRTTIRAVGYAGRVVLWGLLVVTALQNFGVNVSALVTGLGVGGIAVALAVQNILGDLFAALAIVLDRPFVVGDFIIVDDVLGTVEHVGLKTTRLRSLSGEQVVVANSDLLKSRIRNYKRMQERRVVFQLDVTYDTPADTVARIPQIVRSVVEGRPGTRFDRCHFLNWMDSSLRIETVYYVLDADYNRYADTQHAINIELLRRFNAEHIEFAFPSRTVVLKGDAPPSRP